MFNSHVASIFIQLLLSDRKIETEKIKPNKLLIKLKYERIELSFMIDRKASN